MDTDDLLLRALKGKAKRQRRSLQDIQHWWYHFKPNYVLKLFENHDLSGMVVGLRDAVASVRFFNKPRFVGISANSWAVFFIRYFYLVMKNSKQNPNISLAMQKDFRGRWEVEFSVSTNLVMTPIFHATHGKQHADQTMLFLLHIHRTSLLTYLNSTFVCTTTSNNIISLLIQFWIFNHFE